MYSRDALNHLDALLPDGVLCKEMLYGDHSAYHDAKTHAQQCLASALHSCSVTAANLILACAVLC